MVTLGVFARNHEVYLERAHRRTRSGERGGLTTFRSSREWVAAERAWKLAGPGSVPIFFAVVGQPLIRFTARLHEVYLRPQSGSADTKRLLDLEPEETVGEGNWHDGRGTLYSIPDCRPVVGEPFPLSKLTKAKGKSRL